MSTERCGSDGGQGIGAGHVCICNMEKGHALYLGKYHGCSCGALWQEWQEPSTGPGRTEGGGRS